MINKILEIFRVEFNSLKIKFKDQRNLILFNKENERCEGDDYFFACVDFNNIEIIICYNDEGLIEFIERSRCKIKKLKPLVKFFSHHEYGHTTIAPNMSELKNTDINRNFYYRLKNLDVKLYQKSFREFNADLFASEINNKMLKVYLNYKYNIIKSHLEDIEKHKRNIPDLSNFILNLIEFANTFYVFKKWKWLVKLFKKYNEIELLDVLHSICIKYERIIEDNNDFYSKMEKLLDTSKEIEDEITELFTKFNHKINSDTWY